MQKEYCQACRLPLEEWEWCGRGFCESCEDRLTKRNKMTSSDITKLENALVELYGYENFRPHYETCESSPRFAALLAIASHEGEEAWAWLLSAAAKVAKNPKTRAAL